VKDAYRDLAKVWHPDRFGDGDTRLKKKAEEQFKRIRAAYAHLHEHQPPPFFDIEKMPLLEAVQSTTAANLEIARIGDSLSRWMKTEGLANLDEAGLAMKQFLRMHLDPVSRLGRIIHRFESELPDYPRAELESMLDITKEQREQIAEVGASVGLIQSRLPKKADLIFTGQIQQGPKRPEGKVVEMTNLRQGAWITYDYGELDELSLAYAVTIHKAQGSEFPAVVIPVAMQHYMLLQRNLIYTGITRAKRLLVVVGQKKALGLAVRNDQARKRYSGLLCSLKEPGQ
jgi:hypothetical protein